MEATCADYQLQLQIAVETMQQVYEKKHANLKAAG
jgi:hypothetical protein